MARAALQALRRTVTVDWPARAEVDAKSFLIRTALAGHARIMAEQASRAGVVPEYEAYANTPGNSDLEAVVLPGPIVFRYHYIREVIVAALQALRAASPVSSGRYRDSHTLFINGVAVGAIPAKINPKDEIFIANTVPYARRLEVGKTESGRSFVVQVEPHIYERVMKKVLIPRYRNTAVFLHDYVTIPGAYIIRGRLPSHYIAKGGIRRRRRQEVGQPVRAPAIVIGML